MEFFTEVVLPFVVALFLTLMFIITPMAWFDGRAKSKWIKEIRGVEIPWYEATWLDVNIDSVDATIKK